MEFIKILYRWKIRLMFYFNLGWGELALPIAVVRDVGVILGVLSFLFKVNFGWKVDVLICLASFGFFILGGLLLKHTGMADSAAKMGNSVNPELKKINEIAEKLGI